ncbi:bifunctional diguanylate cyclase/phosphodiesterase [Schinkia azotoformans]|uniref:bifunctional diguanylate cyclase/phosphodiesterase n=1 Tax=Schinkia azotoformans TaxID=1454 RepID=UPI002DBA2FB9|nr:EAL domain-containing protein [Schinkia azotoformans]MEC1722074.1 EAL domain-containing protein [Schinkia azotoformans]MED4415221.1 EAL domain-containing protein [Schinkia azotoformans]
MKSILKDCLTLKNGNGTIIALSVLFLLLTVFFRESLYGVFGEQNYLTIHLIMEFFIITIAFSIAIQSWMVFPHILSSYRLWIGALFFAVGLLEVAHAITFKGMPFFLSESSAYKATWFFMVSRLTEVVGLLFIVTSKDRLVSSRKRFVAYTIALVYAVFWLIALYYPTSLFPDLVKEGVGTTTLKNNLQYAGMAVELIIIYVVAVRFRSKEVFNSMLVMASVYLMTADYFFTTYKSVYDVNNFIGHWFQLAGFYFLQRAVYQSSVEEPFLKQKETENLLIQNERFLQTITSNMGEGLIVMNGNGELTYMNHEAERLLGWSEEELLQKNVHDYIHRHKDGGYIPREKCYGLRAGKLGKVYRINEDYFIRKDGVIFPVSYAASPFQEEGQETGSILVFRDITKMKKDQELIQYMAFYDELTKLPNIRYLKERWDETVKTLPTNKAAILILDINRFKNINEALGHSFGDLILQAAANRLHENISKEMQLCRLTGDEFVLVLPTGDEQEVITIYNRIHQSFKEPIQAQHLLLNVTMRCGVALYPEDGANLDILLQHANSALAEAQNKNKSVQFYELSMDGKALDHLVFENDLYHALSKNELHVVYQPQVDIFKGQVIGLEALLRWQHPVHGWISPLKFISIAEETGLIIPIGQWILRTACLQMKEWQDRGIPPLRVSVNLSIRQFYQQNLVDSIKDILEETGLPAEYLELEITESMMMNIEHTKKTLDDLKELGIRIAVDDFGTGYSSLSYLKHLPVDRLKIDKSFVQDIVNKDSDLTIISTIISMAHFLNLEVIAEGVETIFQKEMLQSRHCTQVQGYLISKPLPPDKLYDEFNAIGQKAKEVVEAYVEKGME